MAKAIKILYNGTTYDSLASASKAIGCSPVFIRNALDKTQGDQAEFEKIISNYTESRYPVQIDGYQFLSLSETERATGISARLLKRMKMDLASDKEFTEWVKSEAEGFYALGEWYWSIKQASDKLGVDEKEMQGIFDRYSFSQKELDKHLSNLVANA